MNSVSDKCLYCTLHLYFMPPSLSSKHTLTVLEILRPIIELCNLAQNR